MMPNDQGPDTATGVKTIGISYSFYVPARYRQATQATAGIGMKLL